MGPATWHDEGKLLHLGLGFPLLPFLVAKRGLSGLLTPELSEIFSQLVIRGGGRDRKREVVVVGGRFGAGWGWEDPVFLLFPLWVTSALSFCPDFGMGLDRSVFG